MSTRHHVIRLVPQQSMPYCVYLLLVLLLLLLGVVSTLRRGFSRLSVARACPLNQAQGRTKPTCSCYGASVWIAPPTSQVHLPAHPPQHRKRRPLSRSKVCLNIDRLNHPSARACSILPAFPRTGIRTSGAKGSQGAWSGQSSLMG